MAVVVVLVAGLIGLPKLLPTNVADRATNLAAIVGEADDAKTTAALKALRRMGPNGETAVEPLATLLSKSATDRRFHLLDTLGRLGPTALPHLVVIAVGPDAELALVATNGLNRIGAVAAPAQVRVWKHSPHAAVRQQADKSVREAAEVALRKIQGK